MNSYELYKIENSAHSNNNVDSCAWNFEFFNREKTEFDFKNSQNIEMVNYNQIKKDVKTIELYSDENCLRGI